MTSLKERSEVRVIGTSPATSGRTLTLFIPGLFGPTGENHAVGLKLPALETLLARARVVYPLASALAREACGEGRGECPSLRSEEIQHLSYEEELCHLFGIHSDPDGGLPIAALTHLIDFDSNHEGIWIRADPVYLRPDLSKLLLFDAAALKLRAKEAEMLVAEVNAGISQEGWSLIIGRDYTRWYLRLPQLPRVRTWPPTVAVGQHIDPYLPVGPDARAWHRLTNEVQMILHTSQINRARQAQGELPVNSVWFWGGGVLPDVPAVLWSGVWSNEPVAQGLAKLCGCPFAEIPAHPLTLIEAEEFNGDLLVVLHQGQRLKRIEDIEGWRNYILELEQSWFMPLLRALKARKFVSLTIHTGEARFTVTLHGLRRFWLRRKPITRYTSSVSVATFLSSTSLYSSLLKDGYFPVPSPRASLLKDGYSPLPSPRASLLKDGHSPLPSPRWSMASMLLRRPAVWPLIL